MEKITFSIDKAVYEIDLNEEHAKALRDALARYVGAARRTTRALRRPVPLVQASPIAPQVPAEADEILAAAVQAPRRRGRPPGFRNTPKLQSVPLAL